ncbi:MAG TPA: choice-of-anchor D domain-containing protein [Candidatus Kapabacteria bacterium]|nr:choice-of-anchor D domain-containing protein [Candidatus Kapabacteria bacterium]
MKNLFVRTALGILALTTIVSVSLAQKYLPDTARIAFVNSDRHAILAKRLGAPNVDTLIKSMGTASFSNLSVLASKRDGSSLLVAGTVTFPKPDGSGTMFTYDILSKVDTPFFFSGNAKDIKFNAQHTKITALGSFNLLQVYSAPDPSQLKFPIGTLTQNENDWYVTWTKTAVGLLPCWFYHGKFDGSDAIIDSFQLDLSNIGDYHMTNLMTTPDNRNMLVAFATGKSSENTVVKVQQWNPRPDIGQTSVFQQTEITGKMRNLAAGVGNVDSSFGFLLRSFSDTRAEITFVQKNRTLTNYTFEVGKTDLTQSPNNRIIPATALPNGFGMFVGFTGSPVTQDDGKEVYSSAAQPGGGGGNGGDIAYNSNGDSVVFISCSNTTDGGNLADSVHSQIWVYRFGDPKATLVHSDEHAMERQPIFMGTSPRLAPAPPYEPGKGTLAQTSLDFGKIKINKNDTKTVILNSITSGRITVDKIELDPSTAPYTVTSVSPVPFNIAGGGSANFSVKFAPTVIGTYPASIHISYHDSLNVDFVHDSVLTVAITGIAETDQSVSPEAEKYFSMTLVPNPLKNSAQVEVTAKENGALSIEIVNAAGASLYKSASKYLASGEQTTFAFNASELGLSDGTYYVLLHTPQGDVMRKAVVIK